MPSLRRLAATAAGVASLAAVAAPAHAQDTGVQPYRFTVEGYLANYWLDRGGDLDRASVGGYGARVMFNRSTPASVARTFFNRSSVGAYATFTSEQDRVSTQNLGVQLDVPLFPTLIGGRLDPFVSLGAGLLRSKAELQSGDDRTTTDFTIIPAAGTKIPFLGGVGFRGDLRLPIVFSDGNTQLNFLAEGGIYISF
ncbi:outer membrane beta-barrel protein [Roseisolibacter sp. H3M3-2]|uniref:outer membrane beta-barrel protein n=1 Tax=Roseisolibacter sp. H3M3-2 TaxID=3031323 RepID=UPI0023DAE4A8|nr:outer membrane beta-barrel protein [Roseisolibacter sp. H3M3-2]MDF1502604.1 outer membrane beta-barrel protein [Roseisolibacter sp. H3M3-2]